MDPIKVDREIMSGEPCFTGTRVPIQNLIDYLAGGHPLTEFLEDFPSVRREPAIRVIRMAGDALLASFKPASSK